MLINKDQLKKQILKLIFMRSKLLFLLLFSMCFISITAQNGLLQQYDYFKSNNFRSSEKTINLSSYLRNQAKGLSYNNNSMVSNPHKTKQSHTQRLDSLISPFSKTCYYYDEYNNCIEQIQSIWNSVDNEWIIENKYERTYNEYGNLLAENYYIWSAESNTWAYVHRMTYIYNISQKIIDEIYYQADLNGTSWIPTIKTNYVYNNDNFLIQRINYRMYYDWIEDTKIDYIYDNNNKVVLKSSYAWNNYTKIWSVVRSTTFSYDVQGNNTQQITTKLVDGNVINVYKNDYVFNTNSKLIAYMGYRWDLENNSWVGTTKFEYTYDVNGNQTQWSESYWASEWVGYMKYEYNFDSSYGKNNLIAPDYYWKEFDNKIHHVNVSHYDIDSDAWTYLGQMLFYYSDLNTTSIPKDEQKSVGPKIITTNRSIIIESDSESEYKFQLVDMRGFVVLKSSKCRSEKIDISHLKNGIYLYVITQRERRYFGKIIKQ